MKKTGLRRIGTALLKALFMFATFTLIVILSRLIFQGNLMDEEMLSPRALGIWNSVFLLLIFESTVFTYHRHDELVEQKFLEKHKRGKAFGILGSVLASVEFYVEYITVALLSFVLPLSVTYDCVGLAIWQEGYSKAGVMAVVLPVLLILELFVHTSVRRLWLSDSMQRVPTFKKEASAFKRTLKGIGLTAGVYALVSLVLPWLIPSFITIANLGGDAIIFLYVALAILAVALAVVASFYIRAIRKRRKFFKRLQQLCAARGVVISKIQKPYLSVLFQQKGVDFTLQYQTKVYDCKLVAGVFPGSPMVFSDTGEGIRQDTLRLFKADILRLNTRVDYRMAESPQDHRKLVVILPVPQRIYASVAGEMPRPADTGEIVGPYTLYNATGFLGALERDIL